MGMTGTVSRADRRRASRSLLEAVHLPVGEIARQTRARAKEARIGAIGGRAVAIVRRVDRRPVLTGLERRWRAGRIAAAGEHVIRAGVGSVGVLIDGRVEVRRRRGEVG